MSSKAPFVPLSLDDNPMPKNIWGAFREHGYWRLLLAQFVSSLGDWIGILAILLIANRVSNGSGAAASLVMSARIIPGFFLASIGGLLVDRWDRRRTMIVCDLGRAALFVLLPFWNSLIGLVVISLLLEMLTLLWGPAKDASLPHLISQKHLATANSLGLVAAYGMFPIGALAFGVLSKLADFFNAHQFFSFNIDQEFLALWADASTYLISALLILSLGRAFKGIRLEQKERLAAIKLKKESRPDHVDKKGKRASVAKGYKEIVEGYKFVGKHRLVRGIMIGLGVGIIGGGGLVPLGPIYVSAVLRGGSGAYATLMVALGTGAAIGIGTLLIVQKKLKRGTVFWASIVLCGIAIVMTGLTSYLAVSVVAVACVGAFAGAGYVTGFTVLQEEVQDDVRGRTFAALYSLIRVAMLFALAVSPLFSNLFDWIVKQILGQNNLDIGSFQYNLAGVRVAIIFGGLITIVAGFLSRSQVVHPDKPVNKSTGLKWGKEKVTDKEESNKSDVKKSIVNKEFVTKVW